MSGDRSPSPARRSFIMLAVLVCMMSAILVATGLLYVSQTEAAGAAGSADAAQARALLWSGAQAIMSRLADQRDRILAGELPELDPQYLVYEAGTRAGVVRLLAVNADGGILAPEAAKLDLNRVDAEALARTGLVDHVAADGIIAWRDGLGRPVQSVSELLAAPGMSIEMLYGTTIALLAIDACRPVHVRVVATNSSASRPLGLADVVTVFSVEPAVQYTSNRRINLNQKWSEELGKRIEERFGADAATVMKQVFESGTKFDSDTSLVKAMRAYKTPLEQWPAILDAFTTEAGDLHFGRLDINAAPREALLALPGVTPEQVDQMISVRQDLSPVERGTSAWPVTSQIISPETYEQMAGRVTARCWTYRVRLAAGEVNADAPDGPIINPQVQELVIDLAGPKPRIAYLRDITLLRDAALMALEANSTEESTFSEPEAVQADVEPAPSAGTQPASRPTTSARPRAPGRGDGENDTQPAPSEPRGPGRIGRWTSGP